MGQESINERLLESTDQTEQATPHKQSLGERIFAKHYLFFGLLSALIFSLSNFLADVTVQRVLNMSASLILGVPLLTFISLYHLLGAISLYKKKGVFWSKEDSSYYKEGQPNWFMIKFMIARGCYALFCYCVYFAILLLAYKSGVNASMIFSLFVGTQITTAFVFHVFFNESLHLKHYIAMLIISLGVISIANSKNSITRNTLETEENISIWIPIGLTVTNWFLIAFAHLFTRIAKERGFPILQYTFDLNTISAVVFVIGFIYCNINSMPFTLFEVGMMSLASSMTMVGFALTNACTAFGKAGPTQAMIQVQSVFQLILEIIFFARLPNTFGVIGMIFAISGVMIILLMK